MKSLIIFVLIFTIFITLSNAIFCYQCDNSINSDCTNLKTSHSYSLIVNCDEVKNSSKFLTNHRENYKSSFCTKTEKTIEDHLLIIRNCGYELITETNEIDKILMPSLNKNECLLLDDKKPENYHCICYDDFCNKSQSAFSIIFRKKALLCPLCPSVCLRN
ncbi:hypothetical protein PVAND_015359 [Polypedilum vanderplanki]|uniref:Protein sleepless n=1 Tax=Polypedilum vanderplanki TaxID=319348 RepID=A0A9J6BBX8_POLVA|nr:hypothetical protein PVAND_015359 [Polypedilum vanderplanki]